MTNATESVHENTKVIGPIGSSGPTRTAKKPPKPYKDFPLSPHKGGKWCKKIRGKIYYFGRWGRIVNGKMERVPEHGWKEALALYKAQADDLHAGLTPQPVGCSDEVTMRELVNQFLTDKKRLMDSGELSVRTFEEYHDTCDRLIDAFGKNRTVETLKPTDFSSLRARFTKQWGPVRLGNEINRVRGVFKYAYEMDFIDRPVKFGPTFVRPDAKTMRKHRAKQPKKFFNAEEIRFMLDVAQPVMNAMILLGVNCGYGPHDCGRLKKEHLDLENGFIEFARPKTGVARRNPIWPETVQAIKQAMSPDGEELVLVTYRGTPWVNDKDQMVSEAMKRVMDDAGCYVPKRGHYALRHVLETVGGESRDQVAVDALMGHIDGSMAERYREGISDERLIAVSNHVRQWLYGNEVVQC